MHFPLRQCCTKNTASKLYKVQAGREKAGPANTTASQSRSHRVSQIRNRSRLAKRRNEFPLELVCTTSSDAGPRKWVGKAISIPPDSSMNVGQWKWSWKYSYLGWRCSLVPRMTELSWCFSTSWSPSSLIPAPFLSIVPAIKDRQVGIQGLKRMLLDLSN